MAETDGKGFGGMTRQSLNESPADAARQSEEERLREIARLEFEARVRTIFPDSPASRLSRISGHVNVRTAQKWLGDELRVPADVRQAVDFELGELARTDFPAALERLIQHGTGDLDIETVAAQISTAYGKLTGLKIR